MTEEAGQNADDAKLLCLTCGGEFTSTADTCPDDGTQLVPGVLAAPLGTLFDERYRVVGLLGYGGVGAVYKAVHERLEQTVAIKILHPKLVDDPDKRARFEREGKALSTLSHINVISAHDYGVTPEHVPYLVMQFVQGKSLESVIKNEGGLSPIRAMGIFRQICDGLIHAHGRGIIHRDLKPANVVLVESGGETDLVKLVDFGIAKLTPGSGLTRQKLTQTGRVFGSPSYMSPEQWSGRAVDVRSDIYSLGCVMYEVLSGKVPFEVESLLEFMLDNADIKPASPSSLKPESQLSPELEKLIERAMSRAPEGRQRAVADLKAALEQTSEYKSYWGQLGSAKKQALLEEKRAETRRLARRLLVASVILLAVAGSCLAWLFRTANGQILLANATLSARRLTSPATDARVMDSEKNLADLYEQHGQYAAAGEQLEILADALRRKLGDESPDLAEVHARLALIYSKLPGQEPRARENSFDAYKMFDALAKQAEQNGNLDRAVSFASSSLAEREKVVEPTDRDLLRARRVLADLEMTAGVKRQRKDLLADAARNYERALAGWKKVSLPVKTEVGLATIGLGNSYLLLGRYSESENVFRNELSVMREETIMSGSVMCGLGNALLAEKKYDDAARQFENALALGAKLTGNPANLLVVGRLEDVARGYFNQGQFLKSAEMYKLAATTREKSSIPTPGPLKMTLFMLGNALNSAGKHDQADPVFKRVLSLEEVQNGKDSDQIPHILAVMANNEVSEGKYDEALKCFERAIEMCEEKGAAARKDEILALSCYANVLLRLGRQKEAMAAHQKLVDMH